MDKFEQKEMKKIRSIKSTWYELLIDYVPELIRINANGFKDKTVGRFKTKTPKQTVYGRGKKVTKP